MYHPGSFWRYTPFVEKYTIILFYKFVRIDDPALFRTEQIALCESLNLKGRMLIAHEGINGTFEGREADIESYKKALWRDPRFSDLVFKESTGKGDGFPQLRIKVRKEVVTLGAGEFDVQKETAPGVSAEELEAMYARNDDFVVLDLRNDFEIEVGQFERTHDPGLRFFRDLPHKLDSIAHLKQKKVVAVCTGGIRCEKATCLLRKEGFENLYQLKDGIHTYMQKFPGKRFKGTLYVFDNRQVTPIAETSEREVISRCFFCRAFTEDFYSDDTVRPSRKVICCVNCIESHAELRSCVNV